MGSMSKRIKEQRAAARRAYIEEARQENGDAGVENAIRALDRSDADAYREEMDARTPRYPHPRW
jgi:hypothetical protein